MLAPGPALDNALQIPLVATHDTGFRPPTLVTMPEEMGANFTEKYRALGYFELERDVSETRVVPPGEAAGDGGR
jgi:hypothetical protein